MKVLIIGGNRFFGKKLAHGLLSQGHQVTLLNRGRLEDGLGNLVSRIICDRGNLIDMTKAVVGKTWDVIYDQVCYTADEARAAVELFHGKVGHYIFTSSQSVYEPGEFIDENDFNPRTYRFTEAADKNTEYAEAKRQCESIFFHQDAFPVTAVRLPFVLGVDDYTGRLEFHIKRIKNSKEIYFPNLDAKLTFIHSDGAAKVLAFLLEKPNTGPINVASFDAMTLRDFVSLVESAVGKKVILAEQPDDKNHSPYGVEKDWFMSMHKLAGIGGSVEPAVSWLPREISSLNSKITG